MIRCFVMMCMVSNPNICKSPEEITPTDHIVTSPMECMRGGAVYFSQYRMTQKTPEEASKPPAWFARMEARVEGDGSDIIKTWVAEQKAKAAMQEMLQIK